MQYKPQHSLIKSEETILATFWQRAAAILIDIIVIAIMMGIINKTCVYFGLKVGDMDLKRFKDVEITGPGWSTKIIAIFPFLYFALLNYFTNGKTIGKWIMHIRIVSIYHHKITFWHCVERALAYLASTGEIFFGFLQMFWNSNRMCLQDRIAETIVISEKPVKNM